jgi:hypothetical protein
MNDLFYEYMDNCMVFFFIGFSSHTNIRHDFILEDKKNCTLHKTDKFEFHNIEMNNYTYIS